MTTAVLLLAAGASSRMGQPKMFLTYQGKTLLQHTVEVAAGISHPVFVVAGEQYQAMETALAGFPVQLIHHEQWQQGIGSSIAAGIHGILRAGYTPDAVIITVCDQPFLHTELLQEMIMVQALSGKGMVACAYSDTLGTPVLFRKQYQAALQKLNGQQGAKRLLQQFPDDVATVLFSQGSIDIDTPEDYERLANLKMR
ncbi:nucleotidyltransferase family protein [Paraflavitalea soli]|uniref:Nucleotidyltransferase family protein n=1 Tax=Paraflavitalea soli TaxID=2315862 RepID=A0A3B7MDS5_9BACT|nr:nucleotidyltransferase family protein [Paraflavitalea soli]AXY72488.1 nucleotidyltransferase family protein [Paraflavitalea soli]